MLCEDYVESSAATGYNHYWYYRGKVINEEWKNMLTVCLKETGYAGSDLLKERLLKALLVD